MQIMKTIKTNDSEVLAILRGIKTSLQTQTLNLCWSVKKVNDLDVVTLRFNKPSLKKEESFLEKLYDKLNDTNSLLYHDSYNEKYKETSSGNLVLDTVGDSHYLLTLENEGEDAEVLGNYFEYWRAIKEFDKAVKYYK